MKKLFTSFVVAIVAILGFSAAAQSPELYLRGTITGNGWPAVDQYKFSTTDGENYTLSLDKLSGDFKIATSNWNNYNFGSVSNIELDKEYVMVNDGMSGNCNLKDGSATNVTIHFTLSTATLKITGQGGVFEYPDLYVVGDLTNWAEPFPEANKMTRNENVYTITLASFPAGGFKVAANGWAPNFGSDAATPDITLNEVYTTAYNGSDIMNTTDLTNVTLTFTYEREGNSTLLMTTNTSVDTIAVDNADAEYYSIDGVRVANPDKGIYIKKANGKVSKVIL